ARDGLDHAGRGQLVRRGGGSADLPTERLGNDERTALCEVESVWSRSGGRDRRRAVGIATVVDRVAADAVGAALRDHERASVRTEGNLRGIGVVSAERPGRVREQTELPVVQGEAGDVRCVAFSAGVEDVDEVAVDG